jgi:hypothetical protein
MITNDLQAIHALQLAWVRWAERLMLENRWPLSGNVDQWISTWAEAVSQIGFFNVNVAGSANPQLEKRIGSQYSYGRQLGRMLDVLAPLVDANEPLLRKQAGKKLDDFRKMAADIERMKERPVEDVVDDVRRWRKSADFRAKLEALTQQLEALKAAA